MLLDEVAEGMVAPGELALRGEVGKVDIKLVEVAGEVLELIDVVLEAVAVLHFALDDGALQNHARYRVRVVRLPALVQHDRIARLPRALAPHQLVHLIHAFLYKIFSLPHF